MIFLDVQSQTVKNIEPILYLVAAIGIIGTIALYVVRILITKAIDRYYESIDKRNSQFERFSKELTDIVHEMKRIVDSMEVHKEYDEEFRSSVDTRFADSALKTRDIVMQLEAKVVKGFSDINKDLEHFITIEKEHYKELKGKISKQWDTVSTLREKITELQTHYKINKDGRVESR